MAAAKLTKFLHPEWAIIYMRGMPGEMLLKDRLKKDPDGDVEVLEPFWQIEYAWPHQELAPPLLIYVDQLANGDNRNIETARIVYERKLVKLMQERS